MLLRAKAPMAAVHFMVGLPNSGPQSELQSRSEFSVGPQVTLRQVEEAQEPRRESPPTTTTTGRTCESSYSVGVQLMTSQVTTALCFLPTNKSQ